ncbi:hypothetical protein C2S53_002602 [Perilla frutescens var. hirtella]|uniref:Uncharacterized protein n=1 Tax=Perilla frutescens var. hirtella TaxID=608512 RepID=A0AAD4ISF3_PERFH|nr:hypothetical protein C2S53_002602 [Perilla frutescens var. hirtella]
MQIEKDTATEREGCFSMLPTTVQGRKMLARKRPKVANNSLNDGLAQEKSTAYTISSSINDVQPSARQLPVMQPSAGFHTQKFIGDSSVAANQPKEPDSMRVVTKGGKKLCMFQA